MKVKINQEEIKKIIPHRDPFLLIDEIIEFGTGNKCVGVKEVTGKEFWIPGHFPNMPIMPGVLMIEALAQVGAFAILSQPKFKGKIAYFAGINNVRFKKMVVPGDKLILETELLNMKSIIGIAEGKGYVKGELVVSCNLTFAIK